MNKTNQEVNQETNEYINFAWNEFEEAGWCDENHHFEDTIQQHICYHLMDLLDVFNEGEHSGASANYTLKLFAKLANFEQIAPLSGNEREWFETADGIFQNKRNGAVFEETKSYYINAIIFIDENGKQFNGCVQTHSGVLTSSKQYIKSFPFVPKTFYISVEHSEDGTPYISKSECKKLTEVFKYYNRNEVN